MSQIVPVLRELVAEAEARRAAALCAVLNTRGSTPQQPGAVMLLRSDFTTAGTLGGGCVEAEVRKRAFELLQQGSSGLLDFVLDHDYGWDDGLICGGRMDVGVMSVDDRTDLDALRESLSAAEARRPARLPVRVQHQGRLIEYRINLEIPPTLLIAGAGHVGQALAKLAVDLDFHVKVIDDRADFASPSRFDPRVQLVAGDIAETLRATTIDASCYVVIVTRGHQHDHQALHAVVRSDAGYIGLIGSRRKAKLIFSDLRNDGVTDEQLARVHTPIGLSIGAVLVPEIAVSIAAELIQVRRRNTPALVEGPFTVSDVQAAGK